MRPCVICGECDEPIGYPHLTTLEGVYRENKFGYWEIYHDGIFYGWFNSEGAAKEKYCKLKAKNK